MPLAQGTGLVPEPLPSQPQLSQSRPPSSRNKGKKKSPSKKKREKEKNHKHQAHNCIEKKAESSASNPVWKCTQKKWVTASNPLPTATQPEFYPVVYNAFTARCSKVATAMHLVCLKDIPGPGVDLRVIKWCDNKPLPLLDKSSQIVALGAAQSEDPTFVAALLRIAGLLEDARA
ncbi:hypothetical protein DXG01_005290 [Tephrocybe rancida]|nr:hypothetical protein DXG01_005290 [Tephrocybe rancida]